MPPFPSLWVEFIKILKINILHSWNVCLKAAEIFPELHGKNWKYSMKGFWENSFTNFNQPNTCSPDIFSCLPWSQVDYKWRRTSISTVSLQVIGKFYPHIRMVTMGFDEESSDFILFLVWPESDKRDSASVFLLSFLVYPPAAQIFCFVSP